MDQPTLPPTLPPITSAKSGLSTGCIISVIVAVILVPICIIAVLAALAVPAGNAVMYKARMLQARAASQGLSIAIKGYQTEYNRYPLPKDLAVPEPTTFTSSGPILNALLAEDSDINPRKIKFLDSPPARKDVNGLLEKDGKRILVDPWGEPYAILLDFDGDGKVPDPEHPGEMLGTTVIVFSAGPDGNSSTWKDNVRSWK